MTEEAFQTKLLGNVEQLQQKTEASAKALTEKIETLETAQKTAGDDSLKLKEAANAEAKALEQVRSEQQAIKRMTAKSANRNGQVSDDCARQLTAIALASGLVAQKFQSNDSATRAENIVKSVLGAGFDNKFRSALTASDIPLPVDYSGEVSELVSQYGTARMYGTVIPLGAGVVKLPRLKTDTTFTVLTQSTAITEKSPATEWVTFTPEKFGGLIIMPTEIDEDSIVAMGQFIARYAARNMARAEDWNFWKSTGTVGTVNGDVEGLAVSTVTNSKTKASGTLGSPSEFTLAHIRSIRSVVDAPAIGRGAYYMHPSFEQLLSSLNTAGDKPYIANGIQGASLDGFPIRWVDVMPPLLTTDVVSTVHILFGDASYQYLGIRGGLRFQSSIEAGFATDDIYVRALERFTIGLMATGAVSGLITHSS